MDCISYVHTATEVLETLHPGVTGLCSLVNLIGLSNSLSTSNWSEMVKHVHVSQQIVFVKPSRPPQWRMSGGLIQTPSQEVSSKLRMEH